MLIETAGATTTADGITARPAYSFEPPPAFFAAEAPAAGPGVFNVLDFGAVADAAFDNRDAIQAAIDAAHDAGGGIVYVPPGIFGIGGGFRSDGVTPNPADGGVQLLDNVFLKGAGIGQSVLRVIDGLDQAITGIVRTPSGETTSNFGAADLTLDGNRANNPTAKTDAFFCGTAPGSSEASSDGYLLRVEAENCKGYGFDPHEQTYRLSIKDCLSHDNGLDGFTLDYQIDGEFIGNVSYDNDRHGFNVVTTSSDCLFRDNVAHDNGGAGFVVQRGTENIEAPHNIVIEGGEVYGNKSDGIRLVDSSNIDVTGVDIHDNGRNGVRIEGSSHITVEDNIIANDSRLNTSTTSSNGVTVGNNAEVYIIQADDTAGSSGAFHASSYNLVAHNTITESGLLVAPYGVREVAGVTDHNQVVDNTISGFAVAPVTLVSTTSSLIQHAGAGDDVLTGTPGGDALYGGQGSDILTGGNGDDLLDGGGSATGSDSLRGGVGDDTYVIDQAGTVVIEGVSAGTDTVQTTLSTFTLSSNVEKLVYVGSGNFAGSGNSVGNVIIGGNSDDTLNGNSGNDLLIGLAGHNTLIGGTGDDTYFLTGGDDTVIETAGNGFDTVFTNGAGTSTIMGNVEQLVLYGNAAGAIGGGSNDILGATQALGAVSLDGGGGNDILYGSRWSDTLTGGAGDDFLIGGDGADVMIGGTGNDVYVLSSGSEVIVEAAGEGYDYELANFVGTTTIGANFEVLMLYGSGTSGLGSAGDDILAAVQILGGVTLDGVGGNDILYGSNFDDRLIGGAGSDVLIDNGGADVLTGGAGDDVYYVSSATAVIVEAAGEGFDFEFTSAAGITTIADNVEELVLRGSATGGIGNGDDNILYAAAASVAVTLDGAGGNDVLYGGAGNDRLSGGAGDDSLTGNGGSDTFDFRNAGSGNDVIMDFDALSAAAHDVIDVSGRGFDASSLGSAIVIADQADGFASITIGGDTIKLLGVTAVELTASHFVF